MPRYPLDKARIWVTGASSGIGRALALELGRCGARLAISARNRAALEGLAAEIGSREVLVLPMDVAERSANRAAAETLEREFGGLDCAVFNAGTCEYVDIKTFDAALFERVMRTNYLSLVYGIEAVLPLLRHSPRPYLLGMSSTVAYGGLPRAEAYGASKAAIRNTLQALRIDLRPEGIPVSVVCPGFVRTPLTDRNDFPMPLRIEAGEAARRIRRGMEAQRAEIHFPMAFSLFYKFIASLPAPLYTRLMAFTLRSP